MGGSGIPPPAAHRSNLYAEIPDSHPRAASLRARARLAHGVERGLTDPTGMIAHGRGEAFDYLLNEVTIAPALAAIDAAGAGLALARRPAISVNGNVAVLCPDAVRALADAAGAVVEVSVFHRRPGRVEAIVDHLREHGITALGAEPDARIPGLDHARALSCSEGVHGADVVLVPLEDGDRCQALRAMGKTVIVIDLNPLSRTAMFASIPIVDEVTRALPAVVHSVVRAQEDLVAARARLDQFDASACLSAVRAAIAARLTGV